MKIDILGSHASLVNNGKTTAFLIDSTVLIDAGSGVFDLSIHQIRSIEHVVLSHAHLDHVVSIPYIMNARLDLGLPPLKIYGLGKTLDTLKRHLLNDALWPSLETLGQNLIKWCEIETDTEFEINGLEFNSIPMNHTVPTLGYCISSKQSTLAFTGDTYRCPAFWEQIIASTRLTAVICDVSYLSEQDSLAQIAKHYTPQDLKSDLDRYSMHDLGKIYLTHLPSQINLQKQILKECKNLMPNLEFGLCAPKLTITM